MKPLLLLIAAALAVVGVALFGPGRGNDDSRSSPTASSPFAVSDPGPLHDVDGKFVVKGGTDTAIGDFALRGGRTIRLRTAETVDGKSCFINEDPSSGIGATCTERGLFPARKVAFLVSFEGGPDTFHELYVSGVVAPGIESLSLAETDGSSVVVRLNRDRAFLIEIPDAALRRDVFPSGLRLFGPNGKLVEEVDFPAVR